MALEDMGSRVTRLKGLLPTLEPSLNNFIASNFQFQIIRTVNPASNTQSTVSSTAASLHSEPRTLFILDSSYNPPSLAHQSIAFAAIKDAKFASPHRLLLLFSTANADKAPKPASFLQRIAMIILFAEDLQHRIQTELRKNNVSIDVGLTTQPYYTDKSAAIQHASPQVYASKPKHVHLIGYDTVVRLLAPKYYPKFNPPLSALNPYFDAGHEVQVLLRPENRAEPDTSLRDQQKYLESLKGGALTADGFKDEWADQIGVLQTETLGNVSSTAAREAASQEDWESLEGFCPPGVSAWIQDQKLYRSES